jgi:hypothetical protein
MVPFHTDGRTLNARSESVIGKDNTGDRSLDWFTTTTTTTTTPDPKVRKRKIRFGGKLCKKID